MAVLDGVNSVEGIGAISGARHAIAMQGDAQSGCAGSGVFSAGPFSVGPDMSQPAMAVPSTSAAAAAVQNGLPGPAASSTAVTSMSSD